MQSDRKILKQQMQKKTKQKQSSEKMKSSKYKRFIIEKNFELKNMTQSPRNNIPSSIYITPRTTNVQRQAQNPQQERRNNIVNKSLIPVLYKIVVALCFVIGYTIYRIFYVKFDNSLCLIDTYYNATWNANRWLHDTAGNVILGIMQVIMDSWIIFAGVGWLILSKNMRFPLAAGLIFLFRSIFLNLEKFPFDDYIVWHSPGFLSFMVPYDRTRDFFFSGHTASLSIVMMEMFYLGWYWVGAFTFLNLVFMMNFLIITRVHYTIDIIAGLIFAVTAFRLNVLIVKYEDFLLSIPFYIGRWIFYKIKKKDNQKEYEIVNPRQTQQAMRFNHDIAM